MTLGNPATLTGGHLYHQRMAREAASNDATLSFVSFPDRHSPLPALAGPSVSSQVYAQRPDVVVFDSIVAALVAPWLTLFSGPRATIIHQSPGGVGHGPIRSVIQRSLDLVTYRRCDRIVVAGGILMDELTKRGIRREKVVLVAPGRDIAATTNTALDLRRGRQSAALCVANWSENKGIVELLHSFSVVPESLCTLHLVGDEEADRRYKARVRRLLSRDDLAKKVVQHGPLPPDEVLGMYRAADMFVLPSWREAYGIVYGEAMAAGLPVVGWNLGNLANLARHECDGFLLEPGDIAGLAEAITKLSEDGELRSRMSKSAREHAGALPTWEESAALFFGVLRALVETKKT